MLITLTNMCSVASLHFQVWQGPALDALAAWLGEDAVRMEPRLRQQDAVQRFVSLFASYSQNADSEALARLLDPFLRIMKRSRKITVWYSILCNARCRRELWHELAVWHADIEADAAGGGLTEWHGTFACTTIEAAKCTDGAQPSANSKVYVRAASSTQRVHCQVQYSRAAQATCCCQQSSCLSPQASSESAGCFPIECCVLTSDSVR